MDGSTSNQVRNALSCMSICLLPFFLIAYCPYADQSQCADARTKLCQDFNCLKALLLIPPASLTHHHQQSPSAKRAKRSDTPEGHRNENSLRTGWFPTNNTDWDPSEKTANPRTFKGLKKHQTRLH